MSATYWYIKHLGQGPVSFANGIIWENRDQTSNSVTAWRELHLTSYEAAKTLRDELCKGHSKAFKRKLKIVKVIRRKKQK